jgi:hypothetical protein
MLGEFQNDARVSIIAKKASVDWAYYRGIVSQDIKANTHDGSSINNAIYLYC